MASKLNDFKNFTDSVLVEFLKLLPEQSQKLKHVYSFATDAVKQELIKTLQADTGRQIVEVQLTASPDKFFPNLYRWRSVSHVSYT